MSFEFPPPLFEAQPGGYAFTLIARWSLLAWTLICASWHIYCQRKQIKLESYDFGLWAVFVIVGAVLALAGISPHLNFASNLWLLPPLIFYGITMTIGLHSIARAVWPSKTTRRCFLTSWVFSISIAVFALGLVLAYDSPVTVREAARRSQCRNNLKQVALALHNYELNGKRLPPPNMGDPPRSWRVSLLPYFGGGEFKVQYDNQVAWDQAPNAAIALQQPYPYICPSARYDKDASGRYFTAYSIPTGPGTVGADPNGTPLRVIEDGLNQTLLVVEACGAQIVWTEPRDVNIASQPAGVNLNGNQRGHSAGWLSSYHDGGTHVALADGSVRFISNKVSPAILRSLALIDDVRPGSF